jgi:hypothetical protein
VLAKTAFDAIHEVPQAWIYHLVVPSSPLAPACQEPTALHQAQMFRSRMAMYLTRVGKLAHRVLTVEQHLDHPKAQRVPERAQLFRSLPKRSDLQQPQPGRPHKDRIISRDLYMATPFCPPAKRGVRERCGSLH